jgi:hypothetical protein
MFFKIFFLYQKLQFTYVQATGEAFSPQKRTSSTSKMKFISFFYVYGSIANPDTDPGIPRNPDSGSTALLVTCVPAPVSHAAAEVAAIQRLEEGVLLLPPVEPGPLHHVRQLVRLRSREHHPEPSTANEKDLKLAHRKNLRPRTGV